MSALLFAALTVGNNTSITAILRVRYYHYCYCCCLLYIAHQNDPISLLSKPHPTLFLRSLPLPCDYYMYIGGPISHDASSLHHSTWDGPQVPRCLLVQLWRTVVLRGRGRVQHGRLPMTHRSRQSRYPWEQGKVS